MGFLKARLLDIILAVLIGVGLIIMGIYGHALSKDTKYEQVSKTLASLQVKYQSEVELNKSLTESWDKERKLMFDQKQEIITSKLQVENRPLTKKKSDYRYQSIRGNGYSFQELHIVNDDNSVGPPIGYVMFYDDGRIVSKIYKHHIDVHTTVSRDSKTGQSKVLSKADYVLDQPGLAARKDLKLTNWTGKPYPINITGGEALINSGTNGSSHFRFWNPHLDLGLGAAISTNGIFNFMPNLGLSLSSYGVSKTQNKFRFARIGVGVNNFKKIGLNAAPILYTTNVTNTIFSNTFLYPSVGWTQYKGINIGMNISLSF